MCCTLDFIRLVLVVSLLMAKYKSAMLYRYQSRSISNRMMIARAPLLAASAEKMLHICVGPVQSHWHSGMLMWHWSRQSLGMTGENQAGGRPKKTDFRGNHRDQLNYSHQFFMFKLHLSVTHFTVSLVSKTANLTQLRWVQTTMLKRLYIKLFDIQALTFT